MLYEKYEAKVKRSIARRKFFSKYKYIFIALVSILIISISAFFYCKGKITGNLVVSDVSYGESLKIEDSLNSMLSDHYFEYRVKNSENWTEVKPSKAGIYEVRAVSNGVFGKRYTKIHEFKINKFNLETEISGNLEYGDLPDIKFKLNNDDSVVKDSYQILDLKYENNQVSGYVDTKNLIIKNVINEDVTSSYEFKEKYEFNLTYYEKKLSLSLLDIKDYTYNEACFDPTNIKVLGLTPDLDIKFDYDIVDYNGISFKDKILNAKDYTLKLSNLKLYKGGLDVTHLYYFDETNLKTSFTVNKVNIGIETNDFVKDFDYKEVNLTDYVLTGNLVSGHSILVVESTTVLEVGTYSNILKVKVVNKDGVDVSNNYTINYKYGNININRIKLNINLLKLEDKVYDGLAINYLDEEMNFEIVSGKLLPGDSFRVLVNYSFNKVGLVNEIKNAGFYTIKALNTVFSSGFANNYDITFNESTVNISKRDITIEFEKESVIYDGYSHIHSGKYNVVSGSLAQNENLNVEIGNSAMTDVGNYGFDNFSFYINNRVADYNYNIKYSQAVLEILKRDVSIKVYDAVCSYNGVIQNPILSYDVLNNYTNYSPNNLTYKVSQNGVICDALDAGIYDILLNEVTDKNHNIIFINSPTLTINKARLNVEPVVKDSTFNGNLYKTSDYKVTVDDYKDTLYGDDSINNVLIEYFMNGHKVEARDANFYEAKVTYFEFVNTLSSNYEVSFTSSYFNINPLNISIELGDYTKSYDGTAFVYASGPNNFSYATNSNHLVLNDEITVHVIFRAADLSIDNPINAGTYTIELDYIEYLNGTKETNYSINYSYGEVLIKQAEITVSLNTLAFKVYDGQILAYDPNVLNYTVTSGQLYGNDMFNINVDYIDKYNVRLSEIKDAGEYRIKPSLNNPYNFTSGNINNYNITCIPTNTTIFKRDITLKPVDSTKIYDDSTYVYDQTKFEVLSLENIVSGENFEIAVKYLNLNNEVVDPILAGHYIIEIYNVLNSNCNLNNYNFSFKTGVLDINRSDISISLEDTNYLYCDSNFDPNLMNYSVNGILYHNCNLKLDLEFVLNNIVVSEAKNVDKYNVFVKNLSIVDSLGTDFSNNYNIVVNKSNALLSITPRRLTVMLNPLSKVYDGNTFNEKVNPVIEGLCGDDKVEIAGLRFTDMNNVDVVPIDVNLYNVLVDSFIFVNTLDRNYIYDFNHVNTKLEITKRVVELELLPLKSIYNGQDYNCQGNLEYKVSQGSLGFIGSDTVTLSVPEFSKNGLVSIPRDAGIYEFINIYINYSLNQNNYEIRVIGSTLTISPKDVTITLEEINSYCYNGEVINYKDRLVLPENVVGLISDEQIEISLTFRNSLDNKIYTDINKLGHYIVEDFKANFIVGNINNYNIIIKNRFSFDVSAKTISIITNDIHAIYQGEKNFITNSEFVVNGELFAGDNVVLFEEFKANAAGTYDNNVTVKIFKNNIDVTALYDINYVYGKVTIDKANLSISYSQELIKKFYDRKEVVLDYNVIGALDPMLNIKFSYYDYDTNQLCDSLIYAGHYKAFIEIDKEDAVLRNYNIVINNNDLSVYKEIIIKKVNLHVTTHSKKFVYTPGISQSYEQFDAVGLIPGDEIIVRKETVESIMLPGVKENSFLVSVAGNSYDINYTYGTLTIDNNLKMTEEILKTYDGINYGDSYKLLKVYNGDNQLISDIEVTLHFKPGTIVRDALTYTDIVDRVTVKYLGSPENTYTPDIASEYEKSYIFDMSSVRLTIEKRNIMLKPKDVVKRYDGVALSDDYNNFEILNSVVLNDKNYGLLQGHSISVETELSTLYNKADVFAARYKIEHAYVFNEKGMDITHNYNVVVDYERQADDTDQSYYHKRKQFLAKAIIKPRKVYLETGSASFMYDGFEHYCNEVSLLNMNEIDTGILAEHYYVVDFNSFGMTKKGTYKNRVRIIIYDNYGNDVTSNYIQSHSYATGTITIY